MIGSETCLVGWVHAIRKVGKRLFIVIWTHTETIQVLFEHNDTVSKPMIDWIAGIPEESLVQIWGTV